MPPSRSSLPLLLLGLVLLPLLAWGQGSDCQTCLTVASAASQALESDTPLSTELLCQNVEDKALCYEFLWAYGRTLVQYAAFGERDPCSFLRDLSSLESLLLSRGICDEATVAAGAMQGTDDLTEAIKELDQTLVILSDYFLSPEGEASSSGQEQQQQQQQENLFTFSFSFAVMFIYSEPAPEPSPSSSSKGMLDDGFGQLVSLINTKSSFSVAVASLLILLIILFSVLLFKDVSEQRERMRDEEAGQGANTVFNFLLAEIWTESPPRYQRLPTEDPLLETVEKKQQPPPQEAFPTPTPAPTPTPTPSPLATAAVPSDHVDLSQACP